ncbi:hypothetical protein [Streptomyces sp. NPDC058086]|uniref:hypothetical protein n=1 Tax=Streptomyces sp. NPDC058086 TaxID=3346334 RepID=UPI0036EADCC9
MTDLTDRLNEIAARWEHGHDELTDGCALCHGEWSEVRAATHGQETRSARRSPHRRHATSTCRPAASTVITATARA